MENGTLFQYHCKSGSKPFHFALNSTEEAILTAMIFTSTIEATTFDIRTISHKSPPLTIKTTRMHKWSLRLLAAILALNVPEPILLCTGSKPWIFCNLSFVQVNSLIRLINQSVITICAHAHRPFALIAVIRLMIFALLNHKNHISVN